VVQAVAIAPDGTWIASAGQDRTIRIWDPRTGEAATMLRVDQRLETCVWHPAGDRLFAGGSAGVYRFELRPAGNRLSRPTAAAARYRTDT
jgi:WD40 repeat protein